MSQTFAPLGPGEERDSAAIGVVEGVAPTSIDIAILREAPHGTGLRQGTFHHFPRINSYVVLPSERGAILAIVTWVGVDDDRSRGALQADQIGLPSPRRRLRALPLGVLRRTTSLLEDEDTGIELDRGVLLFPTVGDPVRLPTRAEVLAAVPGVVEGKLTVPIGRAPMAGDATVRLDPNRLFGRHLAVLGNTGSGKSCTVAHLLRASVDATESSGAFRAIVLDLNGEYDSTFNELNPLVKVRRFSVLPESKGVDELRVPYWLWNYREWLSFTEASSRSQAPQLRRSLHLLRTTDVASLPRAVVGLVAGRRLVRQYQAGAVEVKANSDCLSALDNVIAACKAVEAHAADVDPDPLRQLAAALENTLQGRRGAGDYLWRYGAAQLNQTECASLIPLFDVAIESVGVPEFLGDGLTIDTPTPFDANDLLELLPLIAADSAPEVVGWVAPLVERLRIAFADERLASVCGWRSGESVADWLRTYIPDGATSQITVIDLSLLPPHVLHVVVAVFARVLLEGLERHRRHAGNSQIPTLLVLEEAHALARRHVGSAENDLAVTAARLCRETFERIAREGRKFGLSLIVSSQRPSEISETVLSQCNTFVIHRIVNDHDQNLVKRLVPDSLGALTDELPALPSQTALVLGWAIDVPALVRIADVDEAYRPSSSDPNFASAWTGAVASGADWEGVAEAWIAPASGRAPSESASESGDD